MIDLKDFKVLATIWFQCRDRPWSTYRRQRV